MSDLHRGWVKFSKVVVTVGRASAVTTPLLRDQVPFQGYVTITRLLMRPRELYYSISNVLLAWVEVNWRFVLSMC